MTGRDLAVLHALLAAGAFLLATLLAGFARALDRLGAIRRRVFAETHSTAVRELVSAPESALRGALGALRSAAFVASALLLARALELAGVPGAIVVALVVSATAVAGIEIGLALLVRRGRSTRLVIVLAPVVRVVVAPLLPLLSPLDGDAEPASDPEREPSGDETGETEVRALLDLAGEEGILEENEKQLVASIVDFGDLVVREVMTPRVDMVAIPAQTPLPQLAARFVETKLSRIPVYRDSIDQVAGVVHVQDLLSAMVSGASKGLDAGSIARPPLVVPDTTPVGDLMAQFQAKSLQMAIVIDEFGGVTGLVTLEDLLEEIVGEIGDEHEAAGGEAIVEISPGSWRVVAGIRIEELAAIAGGSEEFESDQADTVGGLVAARLGHIPAAGESVRVGPLLLFVEEVDRRRVRTVRATRVVESGEVEAREEGR